jgi:hypothetical protein
VVAELFGVEYLKEVTYAKKKKSRNLHSVPREFLVGQ